MSSHDRADENIGIQIQGIGQPVTGDPGLVRHLLHVLSYLVNIQVFYSGYQSNKPNPYFEDIRGHQQAKALDIDILISLCVLLCRDSDAGSNYDRSRGSRTCIRADALVP